MPAMREDQTALAETGLDATEELESFAAEETVDGVPVDGVPVLAEVRALAPAGLPAVQAAAAAATGFVAGAAALALVHRHATRRTRRLGRRSRAGESSPVLPILATRSFLVDVHLIGQPEG